jgi:hypothetical protein
MYIHIYSLKVLLVLKCHEILTYGGLEYSSTHYSSLHYTVVVSFTPWALYSEKEAPVLTGYAAGWAPEPVSMLWRNLFLQGQHSLYTD